MTRPGRPAPVLEPPGQERYRVGELITGRYHLIRPLGQGGFGRVWVAHDAVLDVNVAVKIIYLDPDARGTHWERLLQEARSAARFRHPAIVRVFDFGQTELRDPFVAMELLVGETLLDLIQRQGRLPGTRAVQLLLPIADALQTAHASGIVHRDVKPENVFIAEDDVGRLQPKLLDFGIARHVDVDRKLTAKGAIIGTPDYMSPEQARGRADPDARTDVWSFCVMLYEALCGAMPFTGDNYNALIDSIINAEPIPTTRLGAGDAELWRLLDRGLKKDPEDRWESMRALGEALALWLYERGVREDACSASLRTSWLEADFAEVKVDILPTAPPPAGVSTERPAAADEVSPLVTRSAERAATEGRSKALWVAAAAALVVIAVLAATLVLRRTEAAPEHGIEAVERATPVPEPAAAAAVVPSAVTATPTSTAAPEPVASEKPRTPPKVKPWAPAPVVTANKPPKEPARKPAPDFGF